MSECRTSVGHGLRGPGYQLQVERLGCNYAIIRRAPQQQVRAYKAICATFLGWTSPSKSKSHRPAAAFRVPCSAFLGLGRARELGIDMTVFPESTVCHTSLAFTEEFKKILVRMDYWLEECHTVARAVGQDEHNFADSFLIEKILEVFLADRAAEVKKHSSVYRRSLKALVAATYRKLSQKHE